MGVSEAEWDARYAASERIWSGEPNCALVAEATILTPGTALDVGCGEGADAVWLAQRGWQVTGLDVSGVALDRARAWAERNGVQIEWLKSGLVEADLPDGGFDLVAVLYPPLPRTPDSAAERALLAAVAPGGTLLYVHHTPQPHSGHEHHGPDLSTLIAPETIKPLLDASWLIEVDEVRPRSVAAGAGSHHREDAILRVRRLA